MHQPNEMLIGAGGYGFAGQVSSVSTLLIFGNVKLPALKIGNKKAQEKDTCARWIEPIIAKINK